MYGLLIIQYAAICRLLLLPTVLLLRSRTPPPTPYCPSYDACMSPSHILMPGISMLHWLSPLWNLKVGMHMCVFDLRPPPPPPQEGCRRRLGPTVATTIVFTTDIVD